MSRRPGSSSLTAWVKYLHAAASSPCGPPNCSSRRFARPGFGAATRTVYCSRLLWTNIASLQKVMWIPSERNPAHREYLRREYLVGNKAGAMTNACAECPGPRSQSDRSGVTCAQERNGYRPATVGLACVVPAEGKQATGS